MKCSMDGEVLYDSIFTCVIVNLHTELSIEQKMLKINIRAYSRVSRYSILIQNFLKNLGGGVEFEEYSSLLVLLNLLVAGILILSRQLTLK